MFVLIVGAGRVGSSLAREMLKAGHEVSCLDEDAESHARLEVGMDEAWEEAGGIERAEAFVAATNGDNTNIVIAQIAKRRYNVPKVIARILDPFRAEWYEQQGVHTICPTRVAIDMLSKEVLAAAEQIESGRRSGAT
jgi:trk system potassium uptake protein TrkA